MSPSTSKLILVVDDDFDVCETIQIVLQTQGYRVVAASDGVEALSLLRGGERPFLILLDLMMPGMNGIRFRQEQLLDRGIADIPVVAISGDGRVREKAGPMGVADAVNKPFAFATLLEIVRRFDPGRA